MLLFIMDGKRYKGTRQSFQYISCYCLSGNNKGAQDAFVSFQYISCYCLSSCPVPASSAAPISIHLMLLFITSPFNSLMILAHFNTSHVTVYRVLTFSLWSCNLISIHLMLLFIVRTSCYTGRYILISIHLMLLFIKCTCFKYNWQSTISIHLMLLFIMIMQHIMIQKVDFNTSHVTVYREWDNDLLNTELRFQYISCYCLSLLLLRIPFRI